MTSDASAVEDPAERIVVSFRAPEDDPEEWWVGDAEWLVEQLSEPTYLRYLRRAHAGPVAVGEEWAEFVNCGCASPQDVRLRVESVVGGTAVGTGTAIEVVPRAELEDSDATR